MRERSCLTPRRAMSMPSMVIFPLSRSMRRKMQLMRLLLPAPGRRQDIQWLDCNEWFDLHHHIKSRPQPLGLG